MAAATTVATVIAMAGPAGAVAPPAAAAPHTAIAPPAATAQPSDATTTKPAGHTAPAVVGADVRAAAANGPVDVLVSLDPSGGLSLIRADTRGGFGRDQRSAGARDAAAAYAAGKRNMLFHTGSGVSLRRDYDQLPVQLVQVATPQALDALAAAPGVESVQLPHLVHPADVAAAPWLSLTHQPDAQQAGYTGAGPATSPAATVAVLDTGISYNLPGEGTPFGDCSGGAGTPTCRIAEYVGTTANPTPDDLSPENHGTNVAGIVATVAPAAKIDVFNVFTPPGTSTPTPTNPSPTTTTPVLGTPITSAATTDPVATDADVLAALNTVVTQAPAQNIRAVNLSLGDGSYNNTECASSPYSSVFLNLRLLGVVPVVAAGNGAYDGQGFHSGVSSPACASGAVRVGAVYAQASGPVSWGATSHALCTDAAPQPDAVACFSQTGPLLSLLAPGVGIQAAGITLGGTSQATPNVAGAVADLYSANPQATAQQVVQALTTTGPTITDTRGGGSVAVHRLDIAAAAAAVQAAAAEVTDAGCTTTPLPANDDGSTGQVGLPFVADFFGTSYSGLYVNNNGNVTFNAAQGGYTPFTITASTTPMIAPFFADVDTRATGSGPVTYGTTTFGSRPALCVDWNRVGYYSEHVDKLNSFQLLLVDRGDVGSGDFDIVMNYNTLTWETGDASGGVHGMGGAAAGAGFSAGDGQATHFFQFPGSLTPGGLIDTNADTGLINSSRGSLLPGRYIFPVRNGAPPGAATITGTIRDAAGSALSGAPVQACPQPTGTCVTGFTGTDGHYTIIGVTPGTWVLTAMPPSGSTALPASSGPLVVGTGSMLAQDLALTGPLPPPAGTTITDHGVTAGGIPVLFWTDPLSLDTTGCTGGSGQYTISQGSVTIQSGSMTETSPGHYHASASAPFPHHGDAQVHIAVTCPDSTTSSVDFSIYIDPSGTVVNTLGAPVSGATVTLLRSDTADGPFVAVADGSAIMSPSVRSNPETIGTDGVFHWDVLAGFYQVQAAKTGCTAPSGGSSALSAVYEVPPAATGLSLVLNCGESTNTGTSLTASPNPVVVGQPVVLTATVGGTGAAATGTVAFATASGPITGCTAQPMTAGQATCTTTFGHADAAAITVTATYSGDGTHSVSSGQVGVTVGRGTPRIGWAAPSPITYPAALSSTQLNATADVPGTFAYTLGAGGAAATGAVLHAGAGQLLDVTFTPTAIADYTTATAQVPITVLPGSQAITVDPVAAVTFGTPSVVVTAHGGPSGQPVAATSSTPAVCGVASVAGVNPATVTVTVLGGGSCALTLTQAGAGDYAAATAVSVTITIAKASQSIVFSAIPTVLGQSIFSVAALATATSGLPVTFTATGPCTTTAAGAVTVTGSGNCALTASQPGNAQYLAATPVSQSAAVGAATATIGLASSSTTVAAYGPVRLTATALQDVRRTGIRIQIVEQSGRHPVLASCTSGTTCQVTVANAAGQHVYAAQLVKSSGQVQSTSTAVTVTWTAPTVALSASSLTPSSGARVTLTATSSEDVAITPYQIDITDTGSRKVIGRCMYATHCQPVVTGSGQHTFRATIVDQGGHEVDAGAASVTVVWRSR